MPKLTSNTQLNGTGSDAWAPGDEVRWRIGSGNTGEAGKAHGWLELQGLLERVYKTELAKPEDWEWTYAPSIILRGEMEMYGQSHPRFAIRLVPFDRNAGFYGFLNLRRLEETAGRLPEEWRLVERNYRTEIEQLGRSLISEDAAAKLKKPGAVYRESPAIADCLLPVPQEMRQSYKILKAPPELSLACGEGWQCQSVSDETPGGQPLLPDWPNPRGFSGVPYMKHIRMLGAGMCAQAVCFMASALLLHRSQRIHSLAEITRRARDGAAPEGNRKQWVEIAGLNGPEIRTYFRHRETCLNADLGVPLEDSPLFRKDAEKWMGKLNVRRVQTVQSMLALRRYLLADIPVILSVDLARMQGVDAPDIPDDQRIDDPVYPRGRDGNGGTGHGRSDHAILAVGVDVARPECFVVHDPAMFPFVSMTARQWESVCPYREDGKGLEAMTFIPVFPGNEAQIRWGLSTAPRSPSGDTQTGTRNLLAWLNFLYRPHGQKANRFACLDTGFSWQVPPVDLFSEHFRLDLGLAKECINGLKMMEPADAQRFAAAAISEADRIQAGLDRWFWISSQVHKGPDHTGSHVFIWDASGADPDPVLLLAGVKDGEGRWHFYKPQGLLPWRLLKMGTGDLEIPVREIHPAVPGDHAPEARPPGFPGTQGELPPGLDLALMTSCLVTDSVRLTHARPATGCHITPDEVLSVAKERGATCADAYCFMHQQVKALFRPEGDLENAAALDVLAAAWERAGNLPDPAEAARRLAESITVLPIRAFSTFLPEATSEDKEQRRKAALALAFLLQMARKLSVNRDRHDVRVLEVVCGTRIERVAPVGHGRHPGSELFPFMARECSTVTALRLFLETLREADSLAGKECRECVFSVEKEPGDFYTLNSRDALTKLIRLLDTDFKDIRERTGLNLDIPHWGFLCDERIQMAAFARQPDVLSRITHVHLSDHHAGHFCDLPAGYIRPWDDRSWDPWLELLPVLTSEEHASFRKSAGLPPFSGVVSCEIEAARYMKDIERTIAATRRMLGTAVAQRRN